MRAVVERAPLLAAVSRLMGVVERRNTIPILGNICLSLEPGRVRLRATDLEMEAIEIVVAAVDEPGDITIPADKFHDIVRNADPGCQVTISTSKADPRVVVQAGRSRFQLPALPGEDFPTFNADGLSPDWPFPARNLADMLSRVAFMRADTKIITPLNAVYLAVIGDQLTAVACNRSGIAIRNEPAPAGADLSVMVLPKFINQVSRWLGDADGDAYLSSSAGLLRVVCGNATLTTKVFDGEYVNYERLLMRSHEVTATTDQDALTSAARRVMIMGEVSEGKTRSVKMTFGDGAIRLAAKGSDTGEGLDEIAADYEGPERDFLVNAPQMQEAMSNLRGDVVELSFAKVFDSKVNSSGQVVIRAPSDPAMLINLMQMRA